MRGTALSLLIACGTPPSAPPEPAVGVRTWVASTSPRGVEIVSQVTAPAGVEVALAPPSAPGLDVAPKGEARTETAGDLQVVTRRWTLTGRDGHHEIAGPIARWEGQTFSPSPLFVDFGVAPPLGGDLTDIVEPDAIRPLPWAPILGGTALVGLVLLGASLAFRRSPPPADPAPPPPDVRALSAWAAAWADPDLDDEATAAAISRIFREYAEEVLGFPATAATTTEILDHLAALPHLPGANLPRARRLLRATDRIKYADAGATHALFEELDADLRAFVESTRPRGLHGETA